MVKLGYLHAQYAVRAPITDVQQAAHQHLHDMLPKCYINAVRDALRAHKLWTRQIVQGEFVREELADLKQTVLTSSRHPVSILKSMQHGVWEP